MLFLKNHCYKETMLFLKNHCYKETMLFLKNHYDKETFQNQTVTKYMTRQTYTHKRKKFFSKLLLEIFQQKKSIKR
jgi:hypothetical protein